MSNGDWQMGVLIISRAILVDGGIDYFKGNMNELACNVA
jgi:hypothetical protein